MASYFVRKCLPRLGTPTLKRARKPLADASEPSASSGEWLLLRCQSIMVARSRKSSSVRYSSLAPELDPTVPCDSCRVKPVFRIPTCRRRTTKATGHAAFRRRQVGLSTTPLRAHSSRWSAHPSREKRLPGPSSCTLPFCIWC